MPKEALAGVKQVPDFCFKLPRGPSGCWAEGSREVAAGWISVRVSLPPGGFSSPAEPGRPVPGSQPILRQAGSLTDRQRRERECEHQLRLESCRGSRREWRGAEGGLLLCRVFCGFWEVQVTHAWYMQKASVQHRESEF